MKTRILLAAIIVLLSGLIIGFFAGQEYAERRINRFIRGGPDPFEQMLTARLTVMLRLNRDQITAVREKTRVVMQEFEKEARARDSVVRSRMTQLMKDIRPLLDENQQRILDGMTVDDLRMGPPREPPRAVNGLRPPTGPRMPGAYGPQGWDGNRPPMAPAPRMPGFSDQQLPNGNHPQMAPRPPMPGAAGQQMPNADRHPMLPAPGMPSGPADDGPGGPPHGTSANQPE